MECTVKIATIDNIKDIQKLNLQLFEKEFADFDDTLNLEWPLSKEGEEYFQEHISKDDNCTLIALIDDTIIGYLIGSLKDESSYRLPLNSAELENMFVADAYRNIGIGGKLYNAFANWCKKKGVKKISVVASAENKDGINFYRKNGFMDYDITMEMKI